MEWFIAGLTFGFVGSVHCMGMCGPLALSLPGARQRRWKYAIERVLYNGGRALTYVLLGGVAGALGRLVSMAGFQQWLSVAIGAVMLMSVLVPWVSRKMGYLGRLPAQLLRRVRTPLRSLYQRGGVLAMGGIGMLNGLLPCGFVYAALATAGTAGSIATSTIFMGGFGLGTVPAMLAVSVMGRLASTQWRTRLHRLIPVGVALVGVLLIWRGLSLGTFLSPDL